jgi:hypothetical protein
MSDPASAWPCLDAIDQACNFVEATTINVSEFVQARDFVGQ